MDDLEKKMWGVLFLVVREERSKKLTHCKNSKKGNSAQ